MPIQTHIALYILLVLIKTLLDLVVYLDYKVKVDIKRIFKTSLIIFVLLEAMGWVSYWGFVLPYTLQ